MSTVTAFTQAAFWVRVSELIYGAAFVGGVS